MRRELNRLSVKGVERKLPAGDYADGGNLFLQVGDHGNKSWIFRYVLAGRRRWMGLGPTHTVTLAEARDKAADNRRLLLRGVDPIDARDAAAATEALGRARSITFAECAAAYIKAHRAGWKNAKHAEQWTNTIETYCGTTLGPLPVQGIDTGLVLKVLEPIWLKKSETATRVRGRIESILDWAKVRGYRDGENPARWRGHLNKLLAAPTKHRRVRHHAALPFDSAGDFLHQLRAQAGLAARALELVILTACRTGEVIGARWHEFDMEGAVWSIPEERTKTKKVHRVPLSPAALNVVKALPHDEGAVYVFPGPRPGKHISNMAMLELLKRMGQNDLTVHGFRSTFRDWASERTSYPREVIEMALAHAIGNKVEAAYRRGDLFDKRRRLMNEWAKFCDQPATTAKVTPIRSKA